MNDALHVELPLEAMEFAQHQAADQGMSGAEEYVRELVMAARREHIRTQIAAALDEGLASPIVEMNAVDWDELRRTMRERSLGGGAN